MCFWNCFPGTIFIISSSLEGAFSFTPLFSHASRPLSFWGLSYGSTSFNPKYAHSITPYSPKSPSQKNKQTTKQTTAKQTTTKQPYHKQTNHKQTKQTNQAKQTKIHQKHQKHHFLPFFYRLTLNRHIALTTPSPVRPSVGLRKASLPQWTRGKSPRCLGTLNRVHCALPCSLEFWKVGFWIQRKAFKLVLFWFVFLVYVFWKVGFWFEKEALGCLDFFGGWMRQGWFIGVWGGVVGVVSSLAGWLGLGMAFDGLWSLVWVVPFLWLSQRGSSANEVRKLVTPSSWALLSLGPLKTEEGRRRPFGGSGPVRWRFWGNWWGELYMYLFGLGEVSSSRWLNKKNIWC